MKEKSKNEEQMRKKEKEKFYVTKHQICANNYRCIKYI